MIGCSGWLVCYGGKFLLQEQIITGDSLHIDLSGFCHSHLPSSTHMWESLRCPLVRHHFIWTQLEFEKGNDFFFVCFEMFVYLYFMGVSALSAWIAVPHACLVLSEAIEEYQLRWTCSYRQM